MNINMDINNSIKILLLWISLHNINLYNKYDRLILKFYVY